MELQLPDAVLIADDHSLFRTGLRHLVLQLFPESEVVEATNYVEAMATIKNGTQISLILLDLKMPEMDGFTTLANLVQEAGSVPVVVLSGSDELSDMQQCFDKGVMGYIPKSEPPQVILSALQLVLSGGVYVPTEFVSAPGRGKDCEPNALSELTRRQRQVLNLLAEGDSNKEIARNLNVSEATVKAHLATILKTLGAKNRTQAVVCLQKMALSDGNR